MKTLKYFNSLLPERQCDWVVKLLDDATTARDIKNIIQDGESQGENKDNLVKLMRLLRSTSLDDIKSVWLQTLREDKLNQIL